jgi:ribosomal protein S7
MSDVQYKNKKLLESIDTLEEILKSGDRNIVVYIKLGERLLEEGSLTRASKILTDALDIVHANHGDHPKRN